MSPLSTVPGEITEMVLTETSQKEILIDDFSLISTFKNNWHLMHAMLRAVYTCGIHALILLKTSYSSRYEHMTFRWCFGSGPAKKKHVSLTTTTKCFGRGPMFRNIVPSNMIFMWSTIIPQDSDSFYARNFWLQSVTLWILSTQPHNQTIRSVMIS